MYRFIVAIFVFYINANQAFSQFANTDVLHYDINIHEINYTVKSISASCRLTCRATAPGTSTLNLSLLSLNIDSIKDGNGNTLSHSYNDTTLLINLPTTFSQGDTIITNIHYHGSPKMDPGGWGGFYFSGTYAFNMGVGFDSDPHNFGRAWFPCNDNFTDRALYDFHVKTPATYKAFCNGVLISDSTLAGGEKLWHWKLNQSIPTYLASIAVAPYTTWQRQYQGLPVEIACMATDTNNVAATFQHLDSVLYHYSNAYGPYRFDKVGYCLIPFNSGAMEHATSIHIGQSYVNGSLNYESLWVHELAHMWWGDWVTCKSEGDMWLNEGFASFNEGYISEKLYGKSAYRDWIRSNHRKVLQFAHYTDGNYLPLINIPHIHTYGPTVYNKGADVAHTLRNYLGDSLFFAGCRSYFNNLGDGAADSEDLRDELTGSSGIPLQRFFDDWVFTPGFPHFAIDSVQLNSNNNYTIFTRQKSKGNSHIYAMPVKVTATNGIQDTTLIFQCDSINNSFQVSLGFTPTWWAVDRNDEMADAISDYERTISGTGTQTMPETNTSLNVISSGSNAAIVRVEHHWVTPDAIVQNTQHIRISDYHYWSVDGIFSQGFHSKITFNYNGSNNPNAGKIDNTLITGTEDSLVLLYRPSPANDWRIVTSCTLTTGNKTDKVGTITADTLLKGEYALGYRDQTTGMNEEIPFPENQMDIWPNPSENLVNIKINSLKNQTYLLCIYDNSGKNVSNIALRGGEKVEWRAKQHGSYLFSLLDNRHRLLTKKVQIIE